MIKIERTETCGFPAAIRGMRNPMNSWAKSDSKFNVESSPTGAWIGPNDLGLMKHLSAAGSDHGKFLRMILVTVDLTAPLYWWKELDTHKVRTVANSCSTMHKIHAKQFEREDFSTEHLIPRMIDVLDVTVANLNACRGIYLETNDKKWWWQMIQLLPSSYNQKRTILLNYAVLKNIYHSRKNHKLDEWHVFCHWIEDLPYSELITE